MKTFVNVILWIFGFLLVFQVLIRIFRKTIHFPAPAFIGKFLDSKWRRTVQPPQQIIQRSGFQPGIMPELNQRQVFQSRENLSTPGNSCGIPCPGWR